MLAFRVLGVAVSCALLGTLTVTRAHADSDEEMPRYLPEDSQVRPDDDAPIPLRFELNFIGMLDLRSAKDSGSTSYGFGLTYGMGWGWIPATLGLDIMSVNTNEHLTNPTVTIADQDPSRVEASKRSRERTLHFDVWLRIQPPHWIVRPYIEGFLGAQLVQTQYTLLTGSGETEASSETVNDQAWANCYGWGAGVDFWGLFNVNRTVSLTLGVRQLFGADATYKRNVQVGGRTALAEYAFGTNVFTLMLGVISVFDLAAEPDPYAPHRF